jgi:hypothetical protein
MKQREILIVAALASVALLVYQQHRARSSAPATAYPLHMGQPSPLGGGFGDGSLGGYVPHESQMFNWMMGQF